MVLFSFAFAGAKTPLQHSLAYKSTAAVASDMFTYQTATALLTRCKVHVTRLFLSFPAFCCVHFLTLVSNYTIFQRTNLKNLCPVRFGCFGDFVGFLLQSYNLYT